MVVQKEVISSVIVNDCGMYCFHNKTRPCCCDLLRFMNIINSEVDPPPAKSSSGIWRKFRNPKDLSFVGYTYRNFKTIKGLNNKKGTSPDRFSTDSIQSDSGADFSAKLTTEEAEVLKRTASADNLSHSA